MRLTKKEVSSIKNIIFSFDPDAFIYLFGSRVNNKAKGGDIDLLIISSKLEDKEIRQIKIKLYDTIGYQKIDILLARDENESALVKIAIEEGVRL
jgi:predicted nucleotidyltransferase